MKKVILFALLMPAMALGQIVDNFESGNLDAWVQDSGNQWIADTSSSLSGSYSLHHFFDNTDPGTGRIGIPIRNLHPSQGETRWTFLVRHGYDPSASNNWSVFLMSDNEPSSMSADGGTNGFAVGVNLTGYDDTLRLWKITDNEIKTVINCGINWQNDIGVSDAVRIIVIRSPDGNWNVTVYHLNGDMVGTASGTDSEMCYADWFGVFYRYSSARDRLLWFDDLSIEGVFYEDNEAPLISGCFPTGKNMVQIVFNEPLSGESVSPGNFQLNGDENRVQDVKRLNSLNYLVIFYNNLNNKSMCNMLIKNICDNSGNCSQNISIPFIPAWAEPGDVLISEIMADPLPVVSLPDKEYIEISNTTDFTFDLSNWKLTVGNQHVLFPETAITPHGIRILCLSEDTMLFAKSGSVIGLKQFPVLNDAGKLLVLSDSSGGFIHGVEYSAGWYQDDLKAGGGWSIEIMDVHSPFFQDGNWRASTSRKGGTPGSENSVACHNPDILFYGIENAFPVDSINVVVSFSETVPALSDYLNSITIGGKNIVEIVTADPLLREFTLEAGDVLKTGEIYKLHISGNVKDFAGNMMYKNSFSLGLPEPSEQGDLLFNEILFNPLPGDPDYIELFNISQKTIDASRLFFVSVNSVTGDTSQAYYISDRQRCILPDSYYTVTTDRQRIVSRYFSADPDFIFDDGSIPSMPDNEGHIILYNRELDKIDEAHYKEKMHYPLLSYYEGVALEKSSPGNNSGEPGSWHSASENSGWGTPGAKNSMFIEMPHAYDNLVLSSSKITPDNDGYEDVLMIRLTMTGNGNVISAIVFDETGNYIKRIAENIYAGDEMSLTWDGTADDGSLVRTGIYIVLITLYDDEGKWNKWKKVCTVIRN